MNAATRRANLYAAGRQLATRLSLATTAAQRRDPEEAAAIRGDWLLLGDALDRADEPAIQRLLEKHDPTTSPPLNDAPLGAEGK